jgi:hypothetical protein
LKIAGTQLQSEPGGAEQGEVERQPVRLKLAGEIKRFTSDK